MAKAAFIFVYVRRPGGQAAGVPTFGHFKLPVVDAIPSQASPGTIISVGRIGYQ